MFKKTKKAKTPASQESIKKPESDSPYSAAIARHQESQLNVAFTRGCIKACAWMSIAIIILLISNSYFAWKAANPPLAVVSSDHGRIIPIPTINDPVYSDADIIDYGARHIREDFTLDFVHYREQINARRDSFSVEGFNNYYNGLVTSNVLSNVRDKKMNLSVLTSSGIIVSKGVLDNGVFAWKIQYPINLRLTGQSSSLPAQSFVLIMMVTRTDPRLKQDGLEVVQIIMRESAQ